MNVFTRLFNSPEADEKVGVIRFKVLSDLWDQKARTIQTVLAIAIGAIAVGASLGASQMISDGLRQGWLDSSPSMISLEVDPPVDQDTLNSIKSIEGITAVEGEMILAAIKWRRNSDELWTPAQLIARQDYDDIELNQLKLVSGVWPERKLMNVETGHGMQEGDQLELQIRHQTLGERTHSVAFNGTVFNVFAPPPATGGVPTFYTTRSKFAELTGEEGFRIIRATAAEYDQAAALELTNKIQDHLKKQGHESQGAFPFGLAVTDPNEHIFNELMVSMYVLLIGMGLLSLVLGLLLVFITMTALITQQIEQIGVMKAIGARQRLIFRIYLSSVLVCGTLALLLALIPGALLAYGIYAGFMWYLNYDSGGFQVSWAAVTVQAAITFLAPMLAALKPIRIGANITVREAISTYGLGGASTMLEKFMAKFKTFPELLALMLSNTFRNRQRAILIMITLIISGVIFMTVMSLGASMSYTYDDLLREIYKFDVTFSFVERQRIDRVESVTLDHPSAEAVEMWNVSGAAARPISQAEKSINDTTAQVLGVPVPTLLYGADVREGRWLEPDDIYAVVLNQRMAWELEAEVGDMLTFNFGPKGDSEWQVVGIAFDPILITSAHVPRDTLEKVLGGKADTVFISTNDALTSWFLREVKSDLNIMVANFRSREPSILGLTEQQAGNYEANVPYFPGDVESPALIRQSIRSADGGFRARRAGSPPTYIPKFSTLVRNKSAIITNWASFYRDVALEDNESTTMIPKLHLPIMEPDGLITSVWNNAVIFCPRAGELGMFMITRHFDSDMLAQQKAQEGSNVPMGARIV